MNQENAQWVELRGGPVDGQAVYIDYLPPVLRQAFPKVTVEDLARGFAPGDMLLYRQTIERNHEGNVIYAFEGKEEA